MVSALSLNSLTSLLSLMSAPLPKLLKLPNLPKSAQPRLLQNLEKIHIFVRFVRVYASAHAQETTITNK